MHLGCAPGMVNFCAKVLFIISISTTAKELSFRLPQDQTDEKGRSARIWTDSEFDLFKTMLLVVGTNPYSIQNSNTNFKVSFHVGHVYRRLL